MLLGAGGQTKLHGGGSLVLDLEIFIGFSLRHLGCREVLHFHIVKCISL